MWLAQKNMFLKKEHKFSFFWIDFLKTRVFFFYRIWLCKTRYIEAVELHFTTIGYLKNDVYKNPHLHLE